ncbi:MAG: Cyanovirin-N [Benniella sp.]|nr:MAG: Cyanovirin-N [Benniella sp.]
MSFHLTSKDIRLVDNHILAASCEGPEGWHDSTIDLDEFIGNSDGEFRTDIIQNFSHSADSVYLIIGQDKVTLMASLRKWDGSWNTAQHLNLSEMISNNGGNLYLADDPFFVVP